MDYLGTNRRGKWCPAQHNLNLTDAPLLDALRAKTLGMAGTELIG